MLFRSAKEYGIGGHSVGGFDNKIRAVNYDNKGLEIVIRLDNGENTKAHWSWNKIADRIATLIDKQEYITQRDIDERIKNAEYEYRRYENGSEEHERAVKILSEYGLLPTTAHDEPLIEDGKTAELDSASKFSSTLMSDESEISDFPRRTDEDNFPVKMSITSKSEESISAIIDVALGTGAAVEISNRNIQYGDHGIEVNTWESRADEIKDFALKQGADVSEHGVFQVVINLGIDGGLDEGYDHRFLDEAVQEARERIRGGAVGAAVYNLDTKKIEYTVGEFDVEHSFTEDVLKANGYLIEEKQTDLERAKELIIDFCEREYGGVGDFSDLMRVPLAYTTDEETDLPINVFADLENKRIISQFNNVTVRVDEYKSLKEMNDLALSELNFDELILDTITANDKLTETLAKSAVETPEQAHSEKTEKPVEIKNLAQLKRALTVGTEFKITSHLRSEVINQTRQVKYADTTGIYSIRPDAPDDTINSANGGRGSYLGWGKASDWEFKNGTCTL